MLVIEIGLYAFGCHPCVYDRAGNSSSVKTKRIVQAFAEEAGNCATRSNTVAQFVKTRTKERKGFLFDYTVAIGELAPLVQHQPNQVNVKRSLFTV